MGVKRTFVSAAYAPRLKRGFSLLEALVVVGILAVIATAAGLSWSGYTRSQNLEAATRDLVAMLREAQGNAIARVNNGNWGVHVTNPFSGNATAELFWNASGTAYVAGNVTRTVTFSSQIDFSRPTNPSSGSTTEDVVFQERTGRSIAGTNAWIAYYDAGTNTALKVGSFIGGGGTSCTNGSAFFECTAVDDDANNQGQYTSIAFDLSGNPWVSYYGVTAGALKVARYVGSGGTGCGGAPTVWTCTAVDNDIGGVTTTGQYSSIAFDPSGAAWASHYDATAANTALKAATNNTITSFGASGVGCATGWRCGFVDNSADVGQYSALSLSGPDIFTIYLVSQSTRQQRIIIGVQGGITVQ